MTVRTGPGHWRKGRAVTPLSRVVTRVLDAYDAYVEAEARRGHPGEEHDTLLCLRGDYDSIEDCCARCSGAMYGTEDTLRAVMGELRSALDDDTDLRATFDLRWKAEMRAIGRWQAAHPGKELVWPDHADLVVWLLGELERTAAR